jgi:PEGA domain/Two component regulator propeller
MPSNKNIFRQMLLGGMLVLIFLSGCERTVTVPPLDVPPPQGYIFIDTYPAGMQIFIDGKDRRRLTPDSITWLESREYEFTLKHPFFLDTAFQLYATNDQRESLYIDYRQNKKFLATLELDSYPQGANIYLNDSLLSSKTPMVLENKLPGYYKVKYVLENHRDVEHTLLLKSSEITKSFLPMLDLRLWVDYNSDNSNLSSDNLTCITKDKFENIWIGSEDWGIYYFDGFMFTGYHKGNSPIVNNTINDLAFTKDRTLLIATAEMAIIAPYEERFGLNDGFIWQFWQVGDSVVPLPDNFVTSVTIEENGQYWFGTKNGLMSTYQEGNINIHRVYNTENSPLPGDHITDLTWFEGELWIATKSDGIALVKEQVVGNEWEIFSIFNSGLRSHNTNTILPLGATNCYVGTSTNSSFTPGLAFRNNGSWYTEYFDMPDNNVRSIFRDSRGRIWVGTESSIIVFSDWEDRIIYTYENTSLPIENISGFLEDINGNILITSLGGGLFRYLD